MPNYSFVFIGPVDYDVNQDKITKTKLGLDKLRKIKNIYILGNKSKRQIPSYIRYLDFGLIPYDVGQDFNRYSFPMKLFEYFYMGKPVISTPLGSVKDFVPLVIVSKNPAQLKTAINKIQKEGWPTNYKKRQQKIAFDHSWEAKIEKISQVLKKQFPEKF
jgi:glycosyltransferase involved in cell wall biosynthesis